MPRRAKPGEATAFIERAVEYEGDDCLLWPFGTTANGYGRVRVGDKRIVAHREVLIRCEGLPPEPDMHAAHKPVVCRSRLCCNKRHLRWATQAENEADKVLDGTAQRGSRNTGAKLTAADVRAIRESCSDHAEIAMLYACSVSHVSAIRSRKAWAWL